MAVINLIYSSGYSIKKYLLRSTKETRVKIPKSEIFRTLLNLLIIKLKNLACNIDYLKL